MPIVLVQLPDADAADVNVPALIAACSGGLRRGTCAAEEEPGGEQATAIAIVSWLDADRLRVRIDVGRRAEGRGGWQFRELTFHEQDAPLERWRSVGLAIAGVVGEATLLEPPGPGAPPGIATEPGTEHRGSGETPPSARGRPAHRDAATRVFRLGVGPTLQTGLSATPELGVSFGPSFGVWLDLSYRLSRAVPLELTLVGMNAWGPKTQGITSRFATVGAGFTATVSPSRSWALRASLLAGLDVVDVGVVDRVDNVRRTASDSRWLFCGLGRVQAAWPESGPVGGVLGMEITALSHAVPVKIHDHEVANSPAFRGSIQAGLELKF